MKKISGTDEANQYYDMVNKLIDQYITEWNIKPSSLSKYLKPGSPKFESFIQKNGLSDIDGIKRIIQDVIEDRKHMELDGILTFEKFKNIIKESILTIDEPTINHEKAIADLFNTSLGHIKLVNPEKHIYEVSDFGDKFKCIVYSKEEIGEIYTKLEEESYNHFCKKIIVIENYTPHIYLHGSDIVSEDKFKKAYRAEVTENKIIKILNDVTNSDHYEEFKGYHIWKI